MEGNTHGRKIILLDTPGWWKCYQLCDTPERLKAELVRSTSICPPGPHVFLLVIEVSQRSTGKQPRLKDALEREWNRREAVDMARIQYRLKYLDANAEMSSCADEEDIQMSLAKVHDWCQKLPLSDYGSISSYEEHDKTEQDRD
ncbi:unnamed protein product [Leuciscus chuanchicus]